MIDDVEIVGVGMHPFGRFRNRTLKDLGRVATIRALDDAGLGVADIGAVYASNSLGGALSGQHQIRGQTVMREVGIEGVPIANVENACASGSTALREAILAVRAGATHVALAVGFEKMFIDDREATLAALRSAADLDVIAGFGLQFTAIYAMRIRKRMDEGALTLDHLAEVSVKSHANGARNPLAQHRRAVTCAEVLASRKIADPITLLMCSSFCDGAAAVLVARRGTVTSTARPRVAVRASVMRSGETRDERDRPSLATLCATKAYEESGVGPRDLDVLEVHDAIAPGELLSYEQLGLCAYGEAGELLQSGATSIGGTRVVNPSGGLSSRGHAVGATGLAQIAELTWQLRGEAGDRQVVGARTALAQNSGGWLEGESAACNVHILERLQP